MLNCKHCNSSKLVKNGFVMSKQRYKCKECGKTCRDGDKREKYGVDKRIKIVKWYLEGAGIRSISRMEGVSAPQIIKWIRDCAKIISEKIKEVKLPESAKEIQILELDELFSYVQKKLTKSTYGLLLIGSEIKLLTLK
jgi:transposase-like protein